MRKSIALGTFVALAAGSAGAGALDAVPSMKGSDTLKNITTNIVSLCTDLATYPTNPPIVYDGTGSSNGETALKPAAALQWIAPMSRPLGTGICDAAAPRAGAEGIVFALDALSMVFSAANAGPAAGIEQAPTGFGASVDWKTALRSIYTGMPATGNNTFARDCNSQARKDLVNSWDALFTGTQTGVCTDSNPGSPVEPGLRHAFRRDEESGTTDVFLAQLSLPSLNFQQLSTSTSVIPAGSNATQTAVYRALAHSPFCNVSRPDDDYAPQSLGGSQIPPMYQVGVPAGVTGLGWSSLDPNLGNVSNFMAPYLPENMDQDPIRRSCLGLTIVEPNGPVEQVCSADGTLGLVLPINPPPGNTLSAADRYPSIPCDENESLQLGPAPLRPTGDPVRCPNGDVALNSKCWLPIRLDASQPGGYAFNCLNNGGLVPAVAYDKDGSGLPGALGAGVEFPDAPNTDVRGNADGRAYNLILRKANGDVREINRPNTQALGSISVPIIGAFYRIHTTRSGLAAPLHTRTCALNDDATDQIGCLALNNPCSMGYAGGGAITTNPGTIAAPVKGVAPTTAATQALVDGNQTPYPIARKLYLNTVRGFETLLNSSATVAGKDAELDLAQCFANLPFSTFASVGGLAKLNVASPSFGFVPLPRPAGSPAGTPETALCEDFVDSSCSGVTTNVDACATVAGGTLNNPTQIPESRCDNGYKDGAETGVDICPGGGACNATTHNCP